MNSKDKISLDGQVITINGNYYQLLKFKVLKEGVVRPLINIEFNLEKTKIGKEIKV